MPPSTMAEAFLRTDMNQLFPFLSRYGYTVVFAWVLGEQIGLPLPAEPFLLVAGGMTGERQLSLFFTFLLGAIASLLADSLWFEIGRSKGASVLSFLCRISLNPDSCVRQTLKIFSRHGAKTLLIAKFIPGINTVAPPLAGVYSLSWLSFLLFDGLGGCIWVGSFQTVIGNSIFEPQPLVGEVHFSPKQKTP